jgi:hypothetical protein
MTEHPDKKAKDHVYRLCSLAWNGDGLVGENRAVSLVGSCVSVALGHGQTTLNLVSALAAALHSV